MKDTELTDLLWVLLRWSWLIVLVVVVSIGSLVYLQQRAVPAYQTQVTLLLSTPDREDVNVTGEYTFTNDRDEITNVSDRFVTIAQYSEVKQRTLQELGLEHDYSVVANARLGADFVTITISADTPELASTIANAHAENAIEYFGEIRALPSTEALEHFDAELQTAFQELGDARQALADFYTANSIIPLEAELESQNSVLERLELLRVNVLVPIYDPNADFVPSRNTTTVDNLITEQREEITILAALLPEYRHLQAEVDTAQAIYDTLMSKYTETEMRQSFVRESMFLQIIDPADVPTAPVSSPMRTYILGAVGSLGLGILLAFFLDYLFAKR
jgi:uncharacterized protein involved in exopolysaccharide biosynthesis